MKRRDLVFYLPVAVAGGFFAWFGVRTYNLRFRPRPEVGEPTWREGPRVAVALLGELGVWQVKPFAYPLPLGGLKAYLLRLPEPVPGGLSVGEEHYLALSRICTHQGCTVNFVPDPEAASLLYNFRYERPFLGCPCHFGAFDPLLGGEGRLRPPPLSPPQAPPSGGGRNPLRHRPRGAPKAHGGRLSTPPRRKPRWGPQKGFPQPRLGIPCCEAKVRAVSPRAAPARSGPGPAGGCGGGRGPPRGSGR